MLNMELLGGRKTRPQRKFMDAVKEDMQRVCMTEEEARDRVRWWQMIRCNDP